MAFTNGDWAACQAWTADIRGIIERELPDITADKHISRANLVGREHVIYLYDRVKNCYIKIEVTPASQADAVQHGVHNREAKPVQVREEALASQQELKDAIEQMYERHPVRFG